MKRDTIKIRTDTSAPVFSKREVEIKAPKYPGINSFFPSVTINPRSIDNQAIVKIVVMEIFQIDIVNFSKVHFNPIIKKIKLKPIEKTPKRKFTKK